MVFFAFALNACSPNEILDPFEKSSGDKIAVGVEADGLMVSSSVTRATGEKRPAEQVSWLVQPLKKGLDITYGTTEENKQVAILKLLPKEGGAESEYATNAQSGYAEYSFNLRAADGTETANAAYWHDNGLHYFEGVHVPNRIRYNGAVTELAGNRTINGVEVNAVTNFTSDQSGDISTGTDDELSNYYLMAHYLGMPANTKISATVSRILLPFRHRLAHVRAYILIDPSLTNGVDSEGKPIPTKIKGYKSTTAEIEANKENATSSEIRFCNVDVLAGVHDVYNSATQLHTLTPQWKTERKVIPHFEQELSTFKTYDSEKKTYYEGSNGFPSSCPSGFTEVIYNNVPVYDLIVRPTYTSEDNVMYDEDLTGTTKKKIAANKNQILFTIALDNGLVYEKQFEFDLDANYETIVHLKISREGVDYNESGSELWVETSKSDDYYGVDNQNGHTLSQAGSSWQRAYYNTTLIKDKTNPSEDKITDGGFYDETKVEEDGTPGQYITDATWIKNFAQAYKGGAHHGDYFVLAKDITIDARSFPDNFIFTGHLDGFTTHPSKGYHTITVTGTDLDWIEYIETTDYSIPTLYDSKPEGFPTTTDATPAFVLPELYVRTKYLYNQAECNEHNATLDGAVSTSTVRVPAEYYSQEEINAAKPADPAYGKSTSDVKTTIYYSQEEIENAITITSAKDYVSGSNPEAEMIATKTTSDVKTTVYYTQDEIDAAKPADPAYEKTTDDIKIEAIYYTEDEANDYNATLQGAWITGTAYRFVYTLAENLTLRQVADGEYYRAISQDVYADSKYVLPKLYKVQNRHSGTTLFAGLNGNYETNQEKASPEIDQDNKVIYEANVHKEYNDNTKKYFWVPYRTDDSNYDTGTGSGWRAEVMNVTVSGCQMFKSDAVITGNVQNCQYVIGDVYTQVRDHTPAYPKYK